MQVEPGWAALLPHVPLLADLASTAATPAVSELGISRQTSLLSSLSGLQRSQRGYPSSDKPTLGLASGSLQAGEAFFPTVGCTASRARKGGKEIVKNCNDTHVFRHL